MATTILIDGIDFTGQVEGLSDLSITFLKDADTKTSGVRISNELIFRNGAFEYLEAKFFNNTAGGDRDVTVKLITDCCEHEYDFFIRGDAVDYCPAICEITANLSERNEALSKLSEIPDLGGFDGRVDVPYCINVSALQGVLYAIASTFALLIDAIDAALFPFGANLNGAQDLVNELQQSLIGCNREKSGVNIKQYLAKCASDANLTLSTTTTLDVAYDAGTYEDTFYVNSNNNLNNLSCIDFIELVKQPFNADYLIKGGVLYFERVDFFTQILTQFVNVDELYADGRATDAPCYRYTGKTKPSYGRFSYSVDSIDTESNDILTLVNDVVEFNEPFDPYKRGSFDKKIPFSPARFTDDAASSNLNILRPPNQMIMATTISQYPKIVLGKKSNTGRLIPQSRPIQGGSKKHFTYQLWFDAELDVPELYQNFWFLSDPRNTSFLPYQLDDFTFQATCSEMTTVYREGTDLIIETKLGNARAEDITINYSDGTITLSGVQII